MPSLAALATEGVGCARSVLHNPTQEACGRSLSHGPCMCHNQIINEKYTSSTRVQHNMEYIAEELLYFEVVLKQNSLSRQT